MFLVRVVRQSVILLLLVGFGSGCFLRGTRPVDEKKDPWYLEGKSRVNSLDWEGAVKAFEKALETNPRSASAHKELGILYERRVAKPDYAAAIYHYEKLIELRPEDEHADMIKESIQHCKQELAGEVGPIPVDQVTLRLSEERERLERENRRLKSELERLRNNLADTRSTPSTGARRSGAFPPAPGPDGSSRNPGQANESASSGATAGSGRTGPGPGSSISESTSASSRPRTYTVQPGDTLYGISVRFRVSQTALSAANPGVDPLRMPIGKTLVIPSR